MDREEHLESIPKIAIIFDDEDLVPVAFVCVTLHASGLCDVARDTQSPDTLRGQG